MVQSFFALGSVLAGCSQPVAPSILPGVYDSNDSSWPLTLEMRSDKAFALKRNATDVLSSGTWSLDYPMPSVSKLTFSPFCLPMSTGPNATMELQSVDSATLPVTAGGNRVTITINDDRAIYLVKRNAKQEPEKP